MKNVTLRLANEPFPYFLLGSMIESLCELAGRNLSIVHNDLDKPLGEGIRTGVCASNATGLAAEWHDLNEGGRCDLHLDWSGPTTVIAVLSYTFGPEAEADSEDAGG